MGILYLVADAQATNTLRILTKPLLVATLLAYFVYGTGKPKSVFSLAIVGALFFSIVGDAALLFEGDLFFMMGLGAFLLAHLFYIRAFLWVQAQGGGLCFSPIASLFFLLFFVSLMSFFWQDLEDMRIPVLVYGLVISLMGLSAYHLRGVVSNEIFLLIFIGALLFIFSDSMIAVEKFKHSTVALPYPRLFVMIPYLLAQLFLVEGSRRVVVAMGNL